MLLYLGESFYILIILKFFSCFTELSVESNYVYLWLESLDYHYEGQAQLPEKECFFIEARYKDSYFYGDYAFFENGRLKESERLIPSANCEIQIP